MLKKVLKDVLVFSVIIDVIICFIDGNMELLSENIGLCIILTFLPVLIYNLVKKNMNKNNIVKTEKQIKWFNLLSNIFALIGIVLIFIDGKLISGIISLIIIGLLIIYMILLVITRDFDGIRWFRGDISYNEYRKLNE